MMMESTTNHVYIYVVPIYIRSHTSERIYLALLMSFAIPVIAAMLRIYNVRDLRSIRYSGRRLTLDHFAIVITSQT